MPTLDDDITTLRTMLGTNRAALDVLARIADAVELERQQHGTRELARLGDIVRRMTDGNPAPFYAAQRASQQGKPELWRGVQPMKPSDSVWGNEP